MSLDQMCNLCLDLSMRPRKVYATCEAFGYERELLPMAASGHAVLDLKAIRFCGSTGLSASFQTEYDVSNVEGEEYIVEGDYVAQTPAPTLDGVGAKGYQTPDFGSQVCKRLRDELGPGRMLYDVAGGCACRPTVRPCWPRMSMDGPPESPVGRTDRVCAGRDANRSYPRSPRDVPCVIRRNSDKRGDNFVVEWTHEVRFEDGTRQRSRWWSVKGLGLQEAYAQAW